MAHPLRLRILRLCLHESLTNKEMADRLDKNPATVLHHVRMLADTGFLRGERARTGARGALEKPYRATGKSWTLSVESFPADARQVDASGDDRRPAGRADRRRPGQRARALPRRPASLNDAAVDELHRRLE